MSRKNQIINLTFAEACEYLSVSPDDLTMLRDNGIVAHIREQGRQLYPKDALEITRRLLHLATVENWEHDTLAWFADLSFAAAIGRALLLPIDVPSEHKGGLSANWLETPNLESILTDFNDTLNGLDEAFNNLLRAVVAVGDGQFWVEQDSFERSALFPLINHFEQKGLTVLGQIESIARDASPTLMGLILTFTHIAPPMSNELALLIERIQPKLSGGNSLLGSVSSSDKALIQKEGMVAVDRLYATKAHEIHSQPEDWKIDENVIVAHRRTIQLVANLPMDQNHQIIDNIVDLIRPFVGPFGARVVQLLYEIANDPPFWRNPQITVNTNELLDRLGIKRDANGYHRSKNRERLRDTLNIAHYLEIVGESTDWEDGERVTRAFRKTVLSLIGAAFDPGERGNISTEELFQRGLPRSMVIRLNFYDGIRQTNGQLGTRYVLVRRLADGKELPKANHAATHEALKAYLLLRYGQLNMKTHIISITRQTALEKANIKNKNASMATVTLRKALDKLVAEGIIESYSDDIPLQAGQSFDIVLVDPMLSTSRNE